MSFSISKAAELIRDKHIFALEGNLGGQVLFVKQKDPFSRVQKRQTGNLLHKLAVKALNEANPSASELSDITYQYVRRHVEPLHGKTMQSYNSYALLFKNAISPTKLADVERKQRFSGFNPLTSDELDKEILWKELIDQNKLHYAINTSGVKLDSSKLSLPIQGEIVSLEDLEISKDEAKQQFVWSNSGKEVFRTSYNSKLEGYHFHGISGILPGTSTKPSREFLHAPFSKTDPSGEYKVLICSAINNPGVPRFMGPHSFIGLEDPQGNQTYYGQTMNSSLQMSVENPDRYKSLPATTYINTEVKKTITKESFEKLRADFEKDMLDGLQGSSYFKNNCSGYVVKKAASVGIKIEAEVSNTEWLYLNFIYLLPKFLAKPLKRGYESLPSYFRKALHFIAFPFYAASVIANLVIWSSGFFYKTVRKDISLLDIFFRPWRVHSNHPIKLYEWQQKQLKGAK